MLNVLIYKGMNKGFFSKKIMMAKKIKSSNNLLPTLKNDSQFKSVEFEVFQNLKISNILCHM